MNDNNISFHTLNKNSSTSDQDDAIAITKKIQIQSGSKLDGRDDHLIKQEIELMMSLDIGKLTIIKKNGVPIGNYITGSMEGDKLRLIGRNIINDQKSAIVEQAILEHAKELTKELQYTGIIFYQKNITTELANLLTQNKYEEVSYPKGKIRKHTL